MHSFHSAMTSAGQSQVNVLLRHAAFLEATSYTEPRACLLLVSYHVQAQ